MDSPALRPGALLSETLDLLKAHPVSLLLPLVLLGLVDGGGQGQPRYAFRPGESPLLLLPFFAFLGVVALVVVALLVAATCFAVLMTAKAARAASMESRGMDLAEAFREARPLFVPSLGTFLLWLLVVAVGFVLLVVPGFIALAGLLPLPGVVVAEGLQGTAALRRAWDLTRGHRWSLFLAIVLLFVIDLAASVLLRWIPFVGAALAGLVGGAVLAASVVLGVCAHEHLRHDAPRHAGVVAQGAPFP